jgi:hypothetical protein
LRAEILAGTESRMRRRCWSLVPKRSTNSSASPTGIVASIINNSGGTLATAGEKLGNCYYQLYPIAAHWYQHRSAIAPQLLSGQRIMAF